MVLLDLDDQARCRPGARGRPRWGRTSRRRRVFRWLWPSHCSVGQAAEAPHLAVRRHRAPGRPCVAGPARSAPPCRWRCSAACRLAATRSNTKRGIGLGKVVVRAHLDGSPVAAGLLATSSSLSLRRVAAGVQPVVFMAFVDQVIRPGSWWCAFMQWVGARSPIWCRRGRWLRPGSRDHLGHAVHHVGAAQHLLAFAHQLRHGLAVAGAFQDGAVISAMLSGTLSFRPRALRSARPAVSPTLRGGEDQQLVFFARGQVHGSLRAGPYLNHGLALARILRVMATPWPRP
jgi:hypothetical protein